MAYLQFIGHQLIGVLAVRLAEILVQHYAVTDGKAAVHSIDEQEYQPRDVARASNQKPHGEQDNERNPDAPDIPSEAFGLTARTEIEEREHQHGKHHYDKERRLDESDTVIH